MGRSINNMDTDWRREWEEEQRLTPEEQKEKDREEAEERKLFDELMLTLSRIEHEDYLEDRRREREEEEARRHAELEDHYEDYDDVWPESLR